MTTTVIDSLVVELGLDPSKFTKGQREALEEAKRLEAQQLKSAKNVEHSAGKASDAFRELRTNAIAAFAAVTGSKGVAEFAINAVHAGAAAGRLSRNLNIPTSVISRWQSLATIFGGSAEGMAQSFTSMTDAIEGWKVGDVKPIIADYRALGAAGGTLVDINKGVDQTFRDIGANLRAIHDKDPAMGGYWQRRLGIDPGLYDAMISKQHDFNEELRKMQGITQESAEAAGRLERRWLSFTDKATKGMQNFVLNQVEGEGLFSDDAQRVKELNSFMQWQYKFFEGIGEKITGQKSTPIGGSASASASANVTGSGAFKSQAEKEAFIRAEAARRGINPNVAMAVARSEGFNSFTSTIPGETSYSTYQLHVTPGGRGGHLGDQFKARTGLDPADRANEREAIRFALDDVTRNGWKAFHGAKNTGISQWQGVRDGSVASGDTNKTEVNIGTVIVQPKTDNPQGWAGEFEAAVRNRAFATQANGGQG